MSDRSAGAEVLPPPQASILLATRDRLAYLRLALDSARAQTIRDIEIVVSDDGSTDGTQAYVAGVSARDARVRLITDNPTPGVFENFRHLLGQARSEFVAFMGDDDLLEPTFLETLLAGFADEAVVVSYANFDIIDSHGHSKPKALSRAASFYGFAELEGGKQRDTAYVALRGQLWLGACLYRTSVLTELGLDYERFGSAADWDLAFRLADRGSAYYVPERQWRYRDHGGANSRQRSVANRRAAIAVLSARAFADPRLERLRTSLIRRELLLIATREARGDSVAAREALNEFRAAKGARTSVRYLLVSLALIVPTPLRRLVLQGVGRLRSART